MDTTTIKLLTRATAAGLTFTALGDKVHVTGQPTTELFDELHDNRNDIRALLLADTCAACGEAAWIREADTAIPWCRDHANRRGLQLLRHEAPHLLEQH